MKVAICLSGNMRTYEKSFDFLKRKILDVIDCDIFIHTWDVAENSLHITGYENIENDIDLETGIKNVYGSYLKGLKIEKYKDFKQEITKISNQINSRISSGCTPERAVSMWYKWKKSIEMVDSSYDVVSKQDQI